MIARLRIETIRTRWKKILFWSSGVLVLIIVASLFVSARSSVSLTVLGYTTNQWSTSLAGVTDDNRRYICAVVGVTNQGKRALTYWAYGSPHDVTYEVLSQTPFGWTDPGPGCGLSLKERELLPAQGFIFEAIIATNNPCKVAFPLFRRSESPLGKVALLGHATAALGVAISQSRNGGD